MNVNSLLSDNSKIKAVEDYPIAAPLNYMTRKNVQFNWNDQCHTSFEKLNPDFTKQFIVTVDASKLGCGAILSQNFNGNDLNN